MQKLRRAIHIRQVQRIEREVEDAVIRYLREMFLRVGAEYRETAVIDFDVDVETERLKAAIRPVLRSAMLEGAELEIITTSAKSTATDLLDDYDIPTDLIATDLPGELRLAIEAALDEQFRQDYWEAISRRTRDKLQDIVSEGATEGLSTWTIAQRITRLGGAYSLQRGKAISRTEVSGALNAGHSLSIAYLDQLVGGVAKEWVSVLSNTTRETHAAADGQVVSAKADFTVGGYPARFPGDWRLPPQERISCQCTLISAREGE